MQIPPSYVLKPYQRSILVNGEGLPCAVEGLEIRRAFPYALPTSQESAGLRWSFLCGYPIMGEGSSTVARMRDILSYLRSNLLSSAQLAALAIMRGGFRRGVKNTPENEINKLAQQKDFYWGYRDGEAHVIAGQIVIARESILVGALIEIDGNPYVDSQSDYEASLWAVNDYLGRWAAGGVSL